MSRVKIITDSMTDLPNEIINRYEIKVLPLTISFGEEEYRDGVDLSSQDFYSKLSKAKELPRTSQIPPQVFYDTFKGLLEEGHEILCINGSSRASGTHQSALLAKTDLSSDKIQVFDTMGLSFGGGLLVLEAARMAEEGLKKEDIIVKLTEYKERVDHIFTVETLEYLKKGGRLNPMKAVIGGILNVKPILTVANGIVEPLDKVRGSKKVIGKMVELASERGGDFKDKTIALAHANSPEAVNSLREKVLQELNPKEVITADIGCTIGTHAGPGTLALFYFK
ncbi:DegV family protein [Alkaliphilus serpentinus]|uniref:DegV family protein n=1 Tax=Alkaliphilus serpentinus TaxID=1482731 RepID=A0A833MDM8_9FIRM|nr:DegV family protein [Alkaliphilus serpentinus]KAB3529186.1 DegV family protein [Alkaliphilus serpentinus]